MGAFRCDFKHVALTLLEASKTPPKTWSRPNIGPEVGFWGVTASTSKASQTYRPVCTYFQGPPPEKYFRTCFRPTPFFFLGFSGPRGEQGKQISSDSCTRVRGPPVAPHVSRYTCRSRFPQNPGGFSGVAAVLCYTLPKRPCRTCRP